MDGWEREKAGLRIAYSNKKSTGREGGWVGERKSRFEDCVQQSKIYWQGGWMDGVKVVLRIAYSNKKERVNNSQMLQKRGVSKNSIWFVDEVKEMLATVAEYNEKDKQAS